MDPKDFILHELRHLIKKQDQVMEMLLEDVTGLNAEIPMLKKPKDSNTKSIPRPRRLGT